MLDGITDSMDVRLSKLQEMGRTGKPGVLQYMWSQRVRHSGETDNKLTKFLNKNNSNKAETDNKPAPLSKGLSRKEY